MRTLLLILLVSCATLVAAQKVEVSASVTTDAADTELALFWQSFTNAQEQFFAEKGRYCQMNWTHSALQTVATAPETLPAKDGRTWAQLLTLPPTLIARYRVDVFYHPSTGHAYVLTAEVSDAGTVKQSVRSKTRTSAVNTQTWKDKPQEAVTE